MDSSKDPGVTLPEETPETKTVVADDGVLPVVGIGASAGGLEVFKLLLAELPADTGFAIVFIQHLDPKHHSMLAEILARATAMPVSEAADGMPVEANHVYVIPANVDLTIARGALKLVPRTQAPGSHMPIDRLPAVAGRPVRKQGHRGDPFRHRLGRLGGRGSHQGRGWRDVCAGRGHGEVRLHAAGRRGHRLRGFRSAARGHCRRTGENWPAPVYRGCRRATERERTPAGDEERFGAILAVLHGATGIDFSLYREKMIKRRILRRLALRNIDSLAEYSERLENDSDELMALQRDLLISVTSFFRDRESFECLKKVVFPRILQGRPANETIRVWVAGCATGEEAFSIAISLQEYLNETGAAFPVQIFASDISLAAIEKARTGRYLENIAADLTP